MLKAFCYDCRQKDLCQSHIQCRQISWNFYVHFQLIQIWNSNNTSKVYSEDNAKSPTLLVNIVSTILTTESIIYHKFSAQLNMLKKCFNKVCQRYFKLRTRGKIFNKNKVKSNKVVAEVIVLSCKHHYTKY